MFRASLCPSSGEQACLIPHMVMPGCVGCGRMELGRKQCALCEGCYSTQSNNNLHTEINIGLLWHLVGSIIYLL